MTHLDISFAVLRSYAQVAPRHGVRRAYLSTVELSLFFCWQIHAATARVELRGALLCSESYLIVDGLCFRARVVQGFFQLQLDCE